MSNNPTTHPFKKLTEFLTNTPAEKNSRIASTEMFRKLSRARVLEKMGVDFAQKVRETLEQYSVSVKGKSREEAVDAMRQTPRIVTEKELPRSSGKKKKE